MPVKMWRGWASVQTRLTGVMVAAAAVAVLALVLSRSSETHRIDAYLAADATEDGELLDQALELKGSSLATLAEDYSLWGEIVQFVQTGDRTWGNVNIDEGIGTYRANAAWIFDPAGAQVYAARDSTLAAPLEPLPPGLSVKDEFGNGHFCHFFIAGPDGAVEIRGATIHPSDDDERTTTVRGYFLAARTWNRQYLAELAQLTGKTLRIEPARSGAKPSAEISRKSGEIAFTRPLPGPRGKPEMMLTASFVPGWIAVARRSGRGPFVQAIALALLAVLGLTLVLWIWVTQPLGRIRRSLESGSTEALKPLERSRTEFGQLAQLVGRSFGQNAALVKEVTERKQAETALRTEEERAQKYLDVAGVLLVALDAHGRITLMNRRGCEILGYDEGEIIGRNWIDTCVPERLRIEINGVFKRLIASAVKPVEYYENPVLTRSGEERQIAWHNVVLRDERGRAVGTLSSGEDITERVQTEQALRESETRLHAVFDNSQDAISLSQDGLHVMVNPAYVRMFGLPNADGLIGTPTNGRIAPDQRNRVQDYTDRRSRGEPAPSKYEIRCIRHNGTELDVEVSVSQFQIGTETYSLAMLRDITDRKQSEKALRTSEALHRTLFESATDALFLMDDYRFSECNAATLAIFGCRERGDIVGRYPWDFSPARQMDGRDSHARAVEMMDAALAGRPQRVEWLHARLDGTTFLAEVVLNRVEFGGRPGLLAAVRDITERKRTEQALRESEERFRRFSQTAPDAIVMADDEGHVDFWNEAAERMFGYTREVALGRPLPELVAPPALRERFHAGIANFARTGTGPFLGRLLQYNAIRQDGSEFPVELTMSAMQLQGRWHSIGTIRDITERERAEQALRESETRLHAVFDNSRDAISLSRDGLHVLVNPAYVRMFGFPNADGLIGTPTLERIAPSHRDRVQAYADRRSRDEPSPPAYETRCIRQDGNEFDAEVSVSQYQIGTETYTLALLRDVTERKLAERSLRTSEAQLSNAMEIARLGYWEYDMADDMFTFNDHFYRIFRTTAEEVGGYKMSSAEYARRFVHPDDAALVGIETRKAIEAADSNFSRQLEHRIIYADGGVGYISVRFFIVKDGQGRTVKTYGANQEITERKAAEQREGQLLADAALLRDTAVGFIKLDPRADIYLHIARQVHTLSGGAYVAVSSYDVARDEFCLRAMEGAGPVLERVMGILGRELVGWRFRLEPDLMRGYASAKLRRMTGLNELAHGQLAAPAVALIESTFGISEVLTMGLYWGGEVLGSVNVLTRKGNPPLDTAAVEAFINQAAIALRRKLDGDELEHHRLHLEELVGERTRELLAAQEQLVLQEKLATLGRVAGSVAHELRNPLGAIRNASYFLQATVAPKLEGQPLRHLQIIDEYVQRANKAITMILDFTQSRAVEPDLCTLRSILERAVAETDVPRTVELSITIPPSLPQVLVDDGQVTVVLRNLLTNAVQAMPTGGTVKIQARAGQDVVAVDVTDTGTGIKPEHMENLFKPLFTTKTIGVGLGLAICKVFIEANKGTISVASDVGKGTTFTVTLPAAEGQTQDRRP